MGERFIVLLRHFAFLVILLFPLSGIRAYGQEKFSRTQFPHGGYISPLEDPLALSGSFGEVRTRHFHGGTDYRTGSREGLLVRAVMRGEVVRINVSTRGYGLALYVSHPNGTMSVYGHLQAFNPTLTKWVRQQQYARKRYELELYPPKGMFPIDKGDLLGWSGNTGSSGGPHLHFELRLEGGAVPYDVYLSGITHEDATPPTFRRLYLYDVDTENYERTLPKRRVYRVQGAGKHYRVADTLEVAEVAGFGVDVVDVVNRNSLTCNVNTLQLFVDEQECYFFNGDRVGFNESAYADAHIDYGFREFHGRRLFLLFTLPGNHLSRYRTLNRGLVRLGANEVRRVRILASDVAGNQATLTFHVRGNGKSTSISRPKNSQRISWSAGGVVDDSGYTLTIPPNTLYYDIDYTDYVTPGDSQLVSPRVTLHDEGVPLHRNVELLLRGQNIAPPHVDRVYLSRWSRRRKRFEYYSTVSRRGDLYHAKVRQFGTYALMLDTVPPTIDSNLLARVCDKALDRECTLLLKVRDGETGVSSIEGSIDGKWALWEWEPKLFEIYHQLDSAQTSRGGEHILRLEVLDRVGNRTAVECPFRW